MFSIKRNHLISTIDSKTILPKLFTFAFAVVALYANGTRRFFSRRHFVAVKIIRSLRFQTTCIQRLPDHLCGVFGFIFFVFYRQSIREEGLLCVMSSFLRISSTYHFLNLVKSRDPSHTWHINAIALSAINKKKKLRKSQ